MFLFVLVCTGEITKPVFLSVTLTKSNVKCIGGSDCLKAVMFCSLLLYDSLFLIVYFDFWRLPVSL